jgi:hypothetical protein
MNCRQCDLIFEKESDLNLHKRNVHQRVVVVSSGHESSVSIAINSMLEIEIERQDSGFFHCTQCPFVTINPQSMHNHFGSLHREQTATVEPDPNQECSIMTVLENSKHLDSINASDEEMPSFLKVSGWLDILKCVDMKTLDTLIDTSDYTNDLAIYKKLMMAYYMQNKSAGHSSSLLKAVADNHG